jgi:hypothetical protein
MVESPFMTDELVEVSGKSGPHVVWRPGTNGELVVAEPCGGLPFEVPYRDVERWNPAGDKYREEPLTVGVDSLLGEADRANSKVNV